MTICTDDHESVFGDVVGSEIKLNNFGELVRDELLRFEDIRRELSLDTWVVMPNHLHAIVIINGSNAAMVGAHGLAPLQVKHENCKWKIDRNESRVDFLISTAPLLSQISSRRNLAGGQGFEPR